MEKNSGKKLKEAAALKYSPDSNAPTIVALGKGEVAERMIETARGNDVPVFEDVSLAHTLNTLHIGDEIPPELYEVVAEILVFISKLDNDYGESYGYKRERE